MQRTSSGGMESILASCLLKLCVACEADHEVSLPSLNSATAHDGPIEPWVWTAKSYVALKVLASSSAMAAPTLPMLLVTSSRNTLLLRTWSHSFAGSGSVSAFDHVALICRAALIAAHS